MVIGGPSWRPAFSSGEASWPLDFRIPKVWKSLIFPARENSSFFGKPYAAVLLETDLTTRVFYLSGIWSRAGERKKGFLHPCLAPAFFSEREVNFLGDNFLGVTTISTEAALSSFHCGGAPTWREHTQHTAYCTEEKQGARGGGNERTSAPQGERKRVEGAF